MIGFEIDFEFDLIRTYHLILFWVENGISGKIDIGEDISFGWAPDVDSNCGYIENNSKSSSRKRIHNLNLFLICIWREVFCTTNESVFSHSQYFT